MNEIIKNLKAIAVFTLCFVLISPFGLVCFVVGIIVGLWEFFHRYTGEAAIGWTLASVWILVPVLIVVGLELGDREERNRDIARHY